MNEPTSDYIVPPSSAIAESQNSIAALRLLMAQRHLYSKAKRWATSRWLGMGIIAIMAPLASIIFSSITVYVGALAGLWIFLGRTTLHHLERRSAEQAASIQELFDFDVFQMPSSGGRTIRPALEDIAVLAGNDVDLPERAEKHHLINWYPIDLGQDGAVSIAICQRANASYSDRLLRLVARLWVGAMVTWVVVLAILAIANQLSLETALLGVALPLLPAFLDVYEYWRGIIRAARVRHDMATAIEMKLANGAASLEPADLLVWQSQLFDLRRSNPFVPDMLYRVAGNVNERVMTDVAGRLSNSVKEERDK